MDMVRFDKMRSFSMRARSRRAAVQLLASVLSGGVLAQRDKECEAAGFGRGAACIRNDGVCGEVEEATFCAVRCGGRPAA